MQWERKKILVTVKAYPEKSTKYGETVCVAGITEEGEFIRLYPVHFDYFRRRDPIRKFHWIEVECAKNDSEKLQRKESFKVRDLKGISIVDTSLTGKSIDWRRRNALVKPLLSDSIESLEQRFRADRTSIGLVKVKELVEFYAREPIEEIDMEESKMMQATLFSDKKTVLQKIPHIFRYKFRCSDRCPGGHDMNVEDWEVFEFFRHGIKFYGQDYAILWAKMKDRFESFLKKRDLHFFMGTDSQWGKWMIIGLYYPPLM